MFTDTVQIEDSLITLVDYNWKDELEHFQEEFEVVIQSQDNLESWIEWCEKNGRAKTHIFYHLMVIKAAHPELFTL